MFAGDGLGGDGGGGGIGSWPWRLCPGKVASARETVAEFLVFAGVDGSVLEMFRLEVEVLVVLGLEVGGGTGCDDLVHGVLELFRG